MTTVPTPAIFPRYNTASVGDLIPYANNARTHSDAQVAQIAASIREFGFTNPILTDGDRGIIAGHGRLLAARKLGMTEVPVIELAHLTPAQKRAYVLADNRLALSAGWDDDLLRLELGALQTEGFDFALTGFDIGEIDALFALPTGGLTDPDDIPEIPTDPVSRLGDIWCLGRHRLVCGDATDPAVVAAVLAGVRPHLMVTDPPYGVDYDPAWRNRAGISNTGRVGKVLNDHRADWREAWAQFPGDVAYVLARRLARHHGGGKFNRLRVRHPRADYLGERPPGHGPWALPLAARALLVCRARHRPLGRGSQTNHPVDHPDQGPGADEFPRRRHGAWHPKAGGMHAPAAGE